MTVKQYANEKGVQPESVVRALKRKGITSIGVNDKMPPDHLPLSPTKNLAQNGNSVQILNKSRSERLKTSRKFSATKLLQVLPLPMLGLAASYGVYFFASQFVPVAVAISEAAAFELTYIGLSSMKGLSERLQSRAKRVAIMAVVVSVIYNTLAGAIHMEPDLLSDLSLFWFWFLAIIHGAPLATLAYFVADLIFHQKR